MELTRCSFDDHLFRWPPRARRGICGCGERPAGFMSENRFGLGFRLRWSRSAVEKLSVFGYGLAATARVLTVFVYELAAPARVLTVFGYVLTVFLFVLSMNLG